MLFAESFDPYATMLDASSYWDNSVNINNNSTLVTGRTLNGQAMRMSSSTSNSYIYKNSGANDPVHHFNLAFRQEATVSGATIGLTLTLGDGTLAQCSLGFRQDGAIVLMQGFTATVLATWPNAFVVRDQWYYYEVEIVISDTAGSIKIRRSGNKTTDDFAQSGLNTRAGSANNYANRLTISQWSSVAYHLLDDLMWRSDPATMTWVGDIRPWRRRPNGDVSIDFGRTTPFTHPTTNNVLYTDNGPHSAYYQPWLAPCDATISSISVNVKTAFTATNNMKMAIYSGTADRTRPDTVLQQATTILSTPLSVGINTFTFSPPLAITGGTQYWIAVSQEFSQNNVLHQSNNQRSYYDSTSGLYATFPRPGNVLSLSGATWDFHFYVTMNVVTNAACVSEFYSDAAFGYVYSPTVGDSDLYTIAPLATPPPNTIAVISRGYFSKGDTGSRMAALQLKSGATLVQGNNVTLPANSFAWSSRTDLVDPNGDIPWTNAAIDALQLGPVVTL